MKLGPWPSAVGQDDPAEAQGSCGLFSSVQDVMAVLHDLIKEQPTLLKRETVEMLFTPQLGEGTPAMEGFKASSSLYKSMFGNLVESVKVNHSLGGLLIEEDSTLGRIRGTICWCGSTGTFWLANREKGLAAVYATQVFPITDEKGWNLMQEFIKETWKLSSSRSLTLVKL